MSMDEPLPLPPALRLPARLVLWLLAGGVLAGWLTLVVLHIGDDYRVTHNSGVWLAVADGARHGFLYPPIFDGEHYAGTRYMPLPILLNGVATGLFADPLVGVKLLAAGLMAVLLLIVIVVLRRSSCPWPLAIALAATIVATDTGLQAGTSIGGDLLPAVLQTGALAFAVFARNRRQLVMAGALAGLGLVSKLTGVWGGLAVITWLVMNRQWRAVALFSAVSIGTASLVLGTVQLMSNGGLSEHLLAFSLAGVQGSGSLLRGPNQVLYNLLGHAWGTVVLFPIAALGVLLPGRARHISIFHIALAYALLLLIVIYADVGTGFNQLLDVVVLSALAVGNLAGRATASVNMPEAPVLLLAAFVSVIWAAALDLVRTVGFDVRAAVAAASTGGPASRAALAAAALVKPGEQVLAEDPAIYVALRRQPVVMDPFMVMRLERVRPQLVDPLIARISNRRFDLVVLVVQLDDRSLDFWWNDFHYGPRVAAALRNSYRADGTLGRYFLYRPR